MSALQKVAVSLVAELPIVALRDLLGPKLDEAPVTGGFFCGGGCTPIDSPANGIICGFGCRPALIAGAQGVIDPDGRLGLSEKDIADIRMELPHLRRSVIYQIESQLAALRQA